MSRARGSSKLGASRSSKSSSGMSAERIEAFLQCCEGDEEDMLLAHLLELPDLLNARDKTDDMTALQIAAGYNATKSMRVLLELNAEVDSRDVNERTPLIYACAWGAENAVKLLIQNGAKVDLSDASGQTALMECCKFKQVGCLRILLETGHCDVNQTDENGATALHLAALHRCREAVDVLLEHGARMLLDFSERSPLHYAYDGHKELRIQRVKKHNTAQHKSNLVAQLDMIVFLAQRSNNFIKSLLSVESVDVSDALVNVFGVRSVLLELRADPDIVQENEYRMNDIMRSCCRVLRRGAPHSLGLEEFEVLLNLLTEAADETIDMYVTSIARFVQPTLNTLRLWCSYLLRAARTVLSSLEDGLGFNWSFLTSFTEPFLKLLLSQKDSPAVAATMPYFAHAFDVVWHALATVAVVDFDDLVERDNAHRVASMIRLFFLWAQMFPRADLLRSAQGYLQTLLPVADSSSAGAVSVAIPQHFIPRAPSSDHRLSHGRGVHSAVSRMKLWSAHVDDAGLMPFLSKSAKAQHHANKSTSSTDAEPAPASFQFPAALPADLVHAVASGDYAIRASTLGDIARAPVSTCFMRFLHVHREALLTMIHVSPALLGPKFMDFLLRIPDVLDVRAKAQFVRNAVYGDDASEYDSDSDEEEDEHDNQELPEAARHLRDNRQHDDPDANSNQSDEENSQSFDDDQSDADDANDEIVVELNRIGQTKFQILDQWLVRVMEFTPEQLYRTLSISFVDEEGVGNGPCREAFAIFSDALFCAESRFFEPTPDQSAWHVKSRLDAQVTDVMLTAVGRTIAMSLTRELPLNARLSLPLLKKCLMSKLIWSDLRNFDANLFQSLADLVKKKHDAEYYDALDQAFVYTTAGADGRPVDMPLMPGGEETKLNDKNKHKYADLLAVARMFNSSQQNQSDRISFGFRDLLPQRHVNILQPVELQLLLGGDTSLDINNLREHMVMTGVNNGHACAEWFLELVAEMSAEEHADLLRFWSGSPAVPVKGFEPAHDGFPWTLNILPDESTDMLPSASTCSFLLKIPAYTTKAALRDKLMTAIKHGSAGFDMH